MGLVISAMPEKRFEMLVFDMDGTIFDTMGTLNQLARRVMNKYYGTDPEEAGRLYKKTSGLPFRYQLETLFPENPDNDTASDEFESTKVEMYKQPVEPFPEVFQFLKKWRNEGYKIAVSSNDEQANVETKVKDHTDCFDEILGHLNGRLKGKAHFDLLKEKYHLRPQDMLFVGDSLHDAKMAFENQVQFVGRAGTFQKEEFKALDYGYPVVQNFVELDALLMG